MRRLNRILSITGGTALVLAGGVVALLFVLPEPERPPEFVYRIAADVYPPPAPAAFDPERWKHDPAARFAMLPDLAARYELAGMEVGEVEELLGPLRWSLAEEPGATSYGYVIQPPFGSSTTVLILDLDDQDRVASARLDRGSVPGWSTNPAQSPSEEP